VQPGDNYPAPHLAEHRLAVVELRRPVLPQQFVTAGVGHDLPLAQQQVHDPAAPDVWAGATAMIEDVCVGTAGGFQGVGQDGQVVEGPVVVAGLGEPGDGAVPPGEPGSGDGGGAEGVAEDTAEQPVRGSADFPYRQPGLPRPVRRRNEQGPGDRPDLTGFAAG